MSRQRPRTRNGPPKESAGSKSTAETRRVPAVETGRTRETGRIEQVRGAAENETRATRRAAADQDVLLHVYRLSAGRVHASGLSMMNRAGSKTKSGTVSGSRAPSRSGPGDHFRGADRFRRCTLDSCGRSMPSHTDAGFGADWYDAVGFCRWLGQQMGLAEGDQPYAAPETLDKASIHASQIPRRAGRRGTGHWN